MKYIHLLRHSKAGQTNKRLTGDHSRSLTEKGVELCERVAPMVETITPEIDLILCSSSVRTKQTADVILKNLNIKPDITEIPSLYLAPADEILQLLHGLDEATQSVLIVGHNPGLQQLAITLAGVGDKKLFRDLKSSFPPAALASFKNDGTWHDIETHSATLTQFVTTK